MSQRQQGRGGGGDADGGGAVVVCSQRNSLNLLLLCKCCLQSHVMELLLGAPLMKMEKYTFNSKEPNELGPLQQSDIF